jgi:fibronectin type 3 domain-containing protein
MWVNNRPKMYTSRLHPMNKNSNFVTMKIITILFLAVGISWNASAQSVLKHTHASYYQVQGYAELGWYLEGNPMPASISLYRSETGGRFIKTNIEAFVRAKGDTLHYTFNDSTIQRFNIYNYYIEAFDEAGNAIAAPDTVFLPALDYLEMPMPSSILAIGDSTTNTIKIDWQLPLTELIKQLTLYRSTNSVDGFVQVAILDPRQKEFVDDDVRPATPYFYYFDLEYKMSDVKKRSSSFASSFVSNEPPPIPDYFEAEATENGIVLKWEHSDPDTRGFWLYRAEAGKPHELFTPLVPAVDTLRFYEFVDIDSLNPSLSYEYTIRAYSKSHVDGASSDTVLVVPIGPLPLITAPLGLQATPSEDHIFVQWQDIESTSPDFMMYRVVRLSEASTDTMFVSLNFLADTTAKKGVAYTYSVSTINRQYKSGPSTVGVIANLEFDTPSPPSGVIAFPLVNGIRVSWEYNQDNAGFAYEVHRVVRGEDSVMVGRVDAPNVPLQFIDTTAQRNEVYFYTVFAISADGVRSAPSEEVRIRY